MGCMAVALDVSRGFGRGLSGGLKKALGLYGAVAAWVLEGSDEFYKGSELAWSNTTWAPSLDPRFRCTTAPHRQRQRRPSTARERKKACTRSSKGRTSHVQVHCKALGLCIFSMYFQGIHQYTLCARLSLCLRSNKNCKPHNLVGNLARGSKLNSQVPAAALPPEVGQLAGCSQCGGLG